LELFGLFIFEWYLVIARLAGVGVWVGVGVGVGVCWCACGCGCGCGCVFALGLAKPLDPKCPFVDGFHLFFFLTGFKSFSLD
jgi:hypothetical protein